MREQSSCHAQELCPPFDCRLGVIQDIGVAKPPHWLTKAFSLVERDDLMVNLDQLTTLQKV